MRVLVIAVAVTLGLALTSFLADAVSDFPYDNAQIFAPNGKLTESITSATTRNLTKTRVWRVTSTTAWKRMHTATSAKDSTYVDVPAGITELGVSSITPFLHMTSVTGTLERQ
jgi:hypothetical protein